MMKGSAAGGGYKLDRVEMERKEQDVGGGGGGGNNNNSNGIPFVDRSKVRILLCDNNNKSSDEVFTLLCRCSYQVTSARTPRQVIDALNAEGRDIDIILSEVDLPISKGLKMLKYIMRDKELQRIPIIMMSAQDDVSVVVKCLKRGAADYLVKPLRTNELLNVWTHMWRRRQMLGLVEKNILSYDIDPVASDPNTNSTTLFSDDTDDKCCRSSIPELTNYLKDDFSATTFVGSPLKNSSELQLDAPGPSDQQNGQVSTIFKKSGLKFGKSSAFFTYVKTSATADSPSMIDFMDGNASKPVHPSREHMLWACSNNQQGSDIRRQQTQNSRENFCANGVIPSRDSVPGITNVGRSYTPRTLLESQDGWNKEKGGTRIINVERQYTSPTPSINQDVRNSKEEKQPSTVLITPRTEVQVDVSRGQGLPPFPYYMPGMMNQVMMPSPARLYQGNTQNMSNNSTSSMSSCVPLQQHANIPGMSSFPYYPICMQRGQITTTHMWPPIASASSSEAKPTQFERREAALIKFRQKRKDRCFDKKVRYINRKKLAERRPRVRGQFVRLANSIEVDLNGQPTVDDLDEDEEEDVDE